MKALLGQYVCVIHGVFAGLEGLVVDERYVGSKKWKVDIKLLNDDHDRAVKRAINKNSDIVAGKIGVPEMWGRVGYNRDGTINFNAAHGITCMAEEVAAIPAPVCWGTETI